MQRTERQNGGSAERDTARWDPIFAEAVRIIGDLARLSAAATGEREIVEWLQDATENVARAAALVLPLSRHGTGGSEGLAP